PDFPSPQRHANQHHIHDHDAADHYRNRAHQDEYPEKRRADTLPQHHVAIFRANEKIILHSSAQVPSRPQNQLRLILCRLEIPRARFHVDRKTRVDPLDAQKHEQRHDDEIVLVLTKHAAHLFHDANDHELVVAHANALPDKIHTEKQPL